MHLIGFSFTTYSDPMENDNRYQLVFTNDNNDNDNQKFMLVGVSKR